MLSPSELHEKSALPIVGSETGEARRDDCEALEKAELRRRMYERIAQGNALSELEDKAFRLWKEK